MVESFRRAQHPTAVIHFGGVPRAVDAALFFAIGPPLFPCGCAAWLSSMLVHPYLAVYFLPNIASIVWFAQQDNVEL